MKNKIYNMGCNPVVYNQGQFCSQKAFESTQRLLMFERRVLLVPGGEETENLLNMLQDRRFA